jgi:formylglycine-generating enzyme required for sulfatase activity
LKSQSENHNPGGNPIEIQPIPFRPGTGRKRPGAAKTLKWLLFLLTGTIFIVLGTSVWFVLTARRVVVQIEPQADHISISGGIISPKIGDYYLMQPGDYLLAADKTCFESLRQRFKVTDEKDQSYRFALKRQPGLLSLHAHQAENPSLALSDALITIDGKKRGRTPATDIAVKPGQRVLTVQAENYQLLRLQMEVEGCRKLQKFDLALVPAWAEISLVSDPARADVFVDGKSAGNTPLTLELLEGEHDLEVRAPRFKPWRTRLAVKANQPQQLDTIRLEPADGKLAIRTKPAGASVMVDKTFAGQTPLELPLAADQPYQIQISKAGYEKAQRTVTLQSEQSKTLDINLKPKLGTINFIVKPADAILFVNGRSRGKIPAQLRLVAVEHKLEIKKKGYRTYQTRITPRPGFPQEIKVSLVNLSATPAAPAGVIRAANGYELKLIRPGTFTMGSSRREQGRRSNETLRNIKLQRPFYMGVREVTNQEIRQFLTDHNSGSFKRQSLNREPLPAAGLSWRQAALFCNWLSIKDSLKPVYVQKGGKLVAGDPVGTGYRLPTEAEWEYCARYNGNQTALKYPWGKTYPPPVVVGYFADLSAKDLMTNVLSVYNDGYAVSAPPAKFKQNVLGLYDMGGNVSEWCHDYYSIYPFSSQKVYVDPKGPAAGRHHVIKGSSWMHAGISELRFAYRNYSDEKRSDVGFRICRYAN